VALLYKLGLSHRGIEQALSLLGLPLDHVTSWLDVQAVGESLRRAPKGKARVIGLDETYIRLRGRKAAIGVVVDTGGRPLSLTVLGQPDQKAYLAWLTSLCQGLGVQVVVSDDSTDYYAPIEALGLSQQLCLWHFRRTLGRQLARLAKGMRRRYGDAIAELRQLGRELPGDGPLAFWSLLRRPLPPRLRNLVLYVLERWPKLTLHQRDGEVPATTTFVERAIARGKVRYRSTRGLKSQEGAANFFALTLA